MIYEFHNLVGLFGVLAVLTTYLLLQLERLMANQLAYSIINLLGASAILYSLVYDWNLSAALIELSWALISGFGILKYYFKKQAVLPKK